MKQGKKLIPLQKLLHLITQHQNSCSLRIYKRTYSSCDKRNVFFSILEKVILPWDGIMNMSIWMIDLKTSIFQASIDWLRDF